MTSKILYKNDGIEFNKLGDNTTSKLKIDANGNIGINTDSPLYSLDVNGDINYTGSAISSTINNSLWIK